MYLSVIQYSVQGEQIKYIYTSLWAKLGPNYLSVDTFQN